jgi:hypothetical protein
MLRLGIKPVHFEILKSTYASFVESYIENGLISFDLL